MRHLGVTLLVLALLSSTGVPASASTAAAVSCPGVARWPVKTGTDATAPQVDLVHVQTTTIAAMRALPVPPKRPKDQRADATERTVFTIDATLVQFKREPDQDIHLVIDDANKVKMIAEVPDPQCFHGTSRFVAQITDARAVVLRTVSVTTSYKAATSIPITITGVGFFDAKDHGSGGTPNGIELHPVLNIVFRSNAPSTPPPSPTPLGTTPASPSAAQLLRDSGFEDGPTESGWRASPDVITSAKQQSPRSGAYYAWLGGYGKAHTDTLTQQVTIPAGVARVTLSYWIAVFTKEKSSHGSFESTEAFDTLTIEVRGTGGTSNTLAVYSNIDARNAYEQATVDLSAYRGQTVTLAFTATEDNSLITSFLIDDVSVEAQ